MRERLEGMEVFGGFDSTQKERTFNIMEAARYVAWYRHYRSDDKFFDFYFKQATEALKASLRDVNVPEIIRDAASKVLDASFSAPQEWIDADKYKDGFVELSLKALGISGGERIVNLTQHTATEEQLKAGVVEPSEKKAVQSALTFDTIPSPGEMNERAEFLARIASASICKKAMIGGAPFFMSTLEKALISAGITPVYAFSVRESKEEPDGNGGIKKVNIFRHAGFVEAFQ